MKKFILGSLFFCMLIVHHTITAQQGMGGPPFNTAVGLLIPGASVTENPNGQWIISVNKTTVGNVVPNSGGGSWTVYQNSKGAQNSLGTLTQYPGGYAVTPVSGNQSNFVSWGSAVSPVPSNSPIATQFLSYATSGNNSEVNNLLTSLSPEDAQNVVGNLTESQYKAAIRGILGSGLVTTPPAAFTALMNASLPQQVSWLYGATPVGIGATTNDNILNYLYDNYLGKMMSADATQNYPAPITSLKTQNLPLYSAKAPSATPEIILQKQVPEKPEVSTPFKSSF